MTNVIRLRGKEDSNSPLNHKIFSFNSKETVHFLFCHNIWAGANAAETISFDGAIHFQQLINLSIFKIPRSNIKCVMRYTTAADKKSNIVCVRAIVNKLTLQHKGKHVTFDKTLPLDRILWNTARQDEKTQIAKDQNNLEWQSGICECLLEMGENVTHTATYNASLLWRERWAICVPFVLPKWLRWPDSNEIKHFYADHI